MPPETAAQLHVDLIDNPSRSDCDVIYEKTLSGLDAARRFYDPRWLHVVCEGLRHRPYLLTARRGEQYEGVLPLAFVKSLLFGRFLVSLPYVNSGGVLAANDEAAKALIDRAVELAKRLRVKHLELRHERDLPHPALNSRLTSKVHMRLALPDTSEALWEQLKAKVRNVVRKGERPGFTVHWGEQDLLNDFYCVFSRNMRDLGTPVFSRRLFRSIMAQLPGEAEFCIVRDDGKPIAAALLVHRDDVTEVPSASALREYNSRNANSLMYWHLLQRAIERGQAVFDFGRSSEGSGTYRFKKQWGALPEPAVWLYHVLEGDVSDMRRESGKYDRLVERWRRLPVWLTRWIGPPIVRGIP